jgi:heme exporter protein CcmD
MGHTGFVIAAYAVAGVGLLWLIVSSYVGMRKSEALADDLRRRD